MTELLYSLTNLPNLVTILVALSTFATVLTVAAPLLQGDRMRSRMKGVISQRDQLRAQQRAALGGKTEGRLRDRPKGTLAQLVQALNLRQVFEVPAPEWIDQPGERIASSLRTTRCRVSPGSPMKWNTTCPVAMRVYAYTSERRRCVCGGMVFHTLPGSIIVSPITSWQLCTPSGWMYLLIVRSFELARLPRCTGSALAIGMWLVGQAACAGKLAVVSFSESTIVLCGACDGVFLDKGELQRAMELVGSDEATTIVALASSVSTAGTIG